MAVLTLIIFLVSLWSVTYYAQHSLGEDMQHLLSDQQQSTAAFVAKNVNDEMSDRIKALEVLATKVTPSMMNDPARLQAMLEDRKTDFALFNNGIAAAGLDGTVIAEYPPLPGRLGANFAERDYIAGPLKQGNMTIGRPVMSKLMHAPAFVIGMPIRDSRGRVIGVLGGVTDLRLPNFLDNITEGHWGRTGILFVASRQHRIIITASDKRRIMETFPARGVEPIIDARADGRENTVVFVNPRGVEVLSSAKGVPVANWFVAVSMPTEEAFAPIRDLERRLLLAAVFASLITVVLTWWMLRHQLAPMFVTTNMLARMAESTETPRPLPITRQDEVGKLIGGFNRLLKTLGQREDALRDARQNLAITLNSIGDAVIATDPSGLITGMNPTAERLCAWPQAEALGRPLTDVFHIVNAETRLRSDNPVQLVMESGKVVGLANHTTLLARDHHEYQIADSAAPIQNASNEIVGVVLVFSDVTERYLAEAAVRHSEQRYRSLLENLSSGVVVHNSDTSILLSNAMAASLLGLTQDQMLGKMALDPAWCFLEDDGTPMSLKNYPVSRVCASGEPLQNLVAGIRHPDRREPTWVICNAYPMHDEEGNLSQVVVTFSDFTEHKRQELSLRRSNERLAVAQRASRSGSWDWDMVSGELVWSDELFLLFGLTPSTTGASFEAWRKLLHSEDLQTAEMNINNAIRDHRSLFSEYRIVLSDGKLRWIAAYGDTVYDAHDQPIRMSGLCLDVTDSKKNEELLRESEARYQALTDLSADWYWEQDEHLRFTSMSRPNTGQSDIELNTFLGHTRREAPGIVWDEPELRRLEEITQAHQPFRNFEIGRVYCGGPKHYVTMSAEPIFGASGAFKGYRGVGADITERKRAEEQIQALAFSDSLTGLPNRRLLMDRLEQALAAASRHGHQHALMFIDLDDFKTINDTLGHDVGDMLLEQIAQRLLASVREGDTVARLGGDEFVVLLQELSITAEKAAAQADVVGTKILSALLEPYELDGHRPYNTASIGVTLFGGSQREHVEEPLKRAELAMYKAKTAGRNTLRFFEPEMRTAVANRAALEADLREAVANCQFILYYQAQGAGHHHLIGVEALVRWQHPTRGLVSPAEFIPIAETSGLILPLGRWVLQTACQQLATWATRPERANLTMAVNVSARQFKQNDFVQEVLSILHDTGANPQQLKLELTESMLVDNVEDIIVKMNALKAMGVGFSLDDFGTGYSSLSYLKRLPLDQLKIDQGFIKEILTDPDDAAIAKMVVALAESMGLSVIAEGVETEAQREFLGKLGSDNYQGYLLSAPLSIQEFEEFARGPELSCSSGF